MANQFHIRSVVICDDVRKEDNGKLILIGVYAGGISVRTFPATLALMFLLIGESDGSEISLEFELIFAGDKESDSFSQEPKKLEADMKNVSNIVIGGIPMKFDGPGILKLRAKEGGSKWKEVCSKRISTFDDPI